MILLDTNVLVYAVGGDHPSKAVAADLLSLAHSGRFRVTPRVLEEFAVVYARRGRARPDAVEFAGEWAALLGPVEFASEEDLAAAFELWSQHADLNLADAVLAAQAMRLDAHLVSADAAFSAVEGLRFANLADPDLAARLGL